VANQLRQGDGIRTPRRYWCILAVSLGTLLAVVDSTIVIVALPTVARDLGVSGSEAISIVAISQVVLLVALLPLAALGDRIGHRRLYQAGQWVFLAASILCLLSPTLPLLLAARALQAVGAAAALSVGMALIRAIYPSGSLGTGLGINGAVVASAAALAPSLGGLIVATIGWRWVFVSTAPLVIASLAFGRALPVATALRDSFDWRGALSYAGTFGALAAALGAVAYGGGRLLTAALFAIVALFAAAFVRREMRRDQPILPVDLLARPVFSLSAAAALATFIGSMTITLSLPFLLEAQIGPKPAEIGALMMAWPLAMMVSAPIAGALADRTPHGALGAFGMLLCAIAYVLIATIPAGAGHADIALRIALAGLGLGFFISPNSRQIIRSAPHKRTAAAGSLISTTRILGQASGAAVVAMLLHPGTDRSASPAVVAACFALLAAVLSFGHLIPSVQRHANSESPPDPLDLKDCSPC